MTSNSGTLHTDTPIAPDPSSPSFSALPARLKSHILRFCDFRDLFSVMRLSKKIKKQVDSPNNFICFLRPEYQQNPPEKVTKEMFAFDIRKKYGIKIDHPSDFREKEVVKYLLGQGLLAEADLPLWCESELENARDNLSDAVYDLITENHLTLEDAWPLSEDEIVTLERICVYGLIDRKRLTVKEALNLSENEISRLKHEYIYKLIYYKRLTVNEVLNLSNDAIKRLNHDDLYNLIYYECLTVEAALNLSGDEIAKLEYASLFSLICGKFITVEEALNLSNSEIDKLKRGNIPSLIHYEYLTVKEAISLSEHDIDNLRYDDLYSLHGEEQNEIPSHGLFK